MTRPNPQALPRFPRRATQPALAPSLPDVRTRERATRLAPVILAGFARALEDQLLAALAEVLVRSPFRHMLTPGGRAMSVAMSNCGSVGWITDRSGYRYSPTDPQRGEAWPPMPDVFRHLAVCAAERAHFGGFIPDACLINRYTPGARLSLHRDADERDRDAPIVSVSLGLPATFLFGGLARKDPQRRLRLAHGDVIVWGGPARLAYHGVLPLAEGCHSRLGRQRVNLTFRKAL
jgi:alkylated DNA repair protein (DNA oxidative demethylase)